MAARPFDWTGYHALANELAMRADEASLRSAVSRAYYCVFHLGLERAKTNGYMPKPGESSHVQLWRNYTGSPDQNCKKLGLIAKRLKGKRERADYEDTYPRLVDEIPGILTDTQDFTAGLVALPIRFPNPAHIRQ